MSDEAPAESHNEAPSLEPGASERDAKKGSGEQAGSTPDETLRALLRRCLPIVQADAQMMADITRHSPLDADSQALHDTTEYESERLVREIPAALVARAPDETLREALAEAVIGLANLVSYQSTGNTPSIHEYGQARRALERCRALATPTKPEMQSVHPAAVFGKE